MEKKHYDLTKSSYVKEREETEKKGEMIKYLNVNNCF